MKYLKKRKLIFLYLPLSLLFHSFFMYLIYLTPRYNLSESNRSPASLLVMTIVDNKDKDPLKNTAKQIVEQNPDPSYIQDSPNKTAKFLSQYHQKVPKETVSKTSNSTNNSSLNNTSKNTLLSKQEKAIHPQKEDISPNLSVADLIPKTNWDQYMNAKKTNTPQRLSEDTINLKNQASLGFQSNDYLKDIEEGKQTLLNTKAFKFYTYYNRIKQQVQISWKSMIQKEVRKLLLQRRENILGAGQKTSLLITLDRSGALVNIKVLKKSHISALDHIAIKSFQLTAPFPHPPKSLIGEKKFLQIRWDFILENV